MIGIDLRCHFVAWALAFAFGGAARSQVDLKVFAGTDSFAVDCACRQLSVGEADAVPAQKLLELWPRMTEDSRRRVVVLLRRQRRGLDGLRQRVREGATSDRVRRAALPLYDDSELLPWTTGRDPLLAVDALRELLRRGRADAAALRGMLATGRDALVDAAVRAAVSVMEPFPAAAFADQVADSAVVDALLDALASRPRAGAVPLLERILAGREAEDPARITIFAAFPRGAVGRERAQEILSAAAAGTAPFHDLVAASERMAPELADRLVGSIYRLANRGLAVEDVLRLMSSLSEKGERRLAALARAESSANRDAVIAWLSRRDAACLNDLLRDLVLGDDVTPTILRRAARLIADDPELRQRAEAILTGEVEIAVPRTADGDAAAEAGGETVDELDPKAQMRLAAFFALAGAGHYAEGLLPFALEAEEPRDLKRRVQALLALPAAAVPDAVFRELLTFPDARLRALTLVRIDEVGAPLVQRLQAELVRIAEGAEAGEAGMALRALIRAAHSESAAFSKIWSAASVGRRRACVSAMGELSETAVPAQRAWRLEFLRGSPQADRVEFKAARLALGDPEVRRQLIENPAGWPTPWLRRAKLDIVKGLQAEDVNLLRRHLVGPEALASAVQDEILDWIERRPELPGGGAAIAALWESGRDGRAEDEMLHERAESMLLARPEGRPRRAAILTQLGERIDEKVEESLFALVAASPSMARAERVDVLARIAFLGPLGNAAFVLAPEEGEDVDEDSGRPRRWALLFALARAWRDGIAEDDRAVVDAIADEAQRHPKAWVMSRAWLGQILTDACRVDSTRRHAAPALARLLLAAPDPDPRYVGAAELVLAEDAEARGAWAEAAEHYEAAACELALPRLDPRLLQVFVAASDPGLEAIPMAILASRGPLCRARAAQAKSEDIAAVRRLCERALVLAQGDAGAENDVADLLRDLDRD